MPDNGVLRYSSLALLTSLRRALFLKTATNAWLFGPIVRKVDHLRKIMVHDSNEKANSSNKMIIAKLLVCASSPEKEPPKGVEDST
jgi:hypothetical protein